MQTVIEISEEALGRLEEMSLAKGTTAALLAGEAVEAFVWEKASDRHAGIKAAFGLWKDRAEDGVAYQERVRAEWDRKWE